MKLDVDFLRQLLPKLPEFADAGKFSNQLKAVNGYDEATAVVENMRDTAFPLVLIEDVPTGYIGFNSGYADRRVTSIWILHKADDLTADARRKALLKSFELGKNVLKLIVYASIDYEGAEQWFDNARTQYIPRGPIAQQVFGYEFMINTIEEIDLSIDE